MKPKFKIGELVCYDTLVGGTFWGFIGEVRRDKCYVVSAYHAGHESKSRLRHCTEDDVVRMDKKQWKHGKARVKKAIAIARKLEADTRASQNSNR